MAVVIDAENTTSGSHVLVLDKLDKEVEAGKVYSFVGKKLAVSKGGYNDVWLTDVTVQDASSEVEPVAYNYQLRYQQMSRYQNRRPTILYGKLQKEGEEFFIVSPLNEKYTFVIDDAAFALDELVGKNVLMPSYKLYYIQDETDPEVYAIHVIATHVQVMELDANPTISYENDKYWTATVTAPENLHYWYWAFDQEKEVTPEDVQSMMDDMVVYKVLSNVGYYTMEDILSWYSFTGEQVYDFSDHDLANNQAVVAIELGENGFPTGKYLLENFKREPIPYEFYLGDWEIPQWGTEEDTKTYWTIAEKEAGKSFTITGIGNTFYSTRNMAEGLPAKIVAIADYNEDGTLSINAQEVGSFYTINEYNAVDVLIGQWNNDSGGYGNTSYNELGVKMLSATVSKEDKLRICGENDYNYVVYRDFAFSGNVYQGYWENLGLWTYIGWNTGTRSIAPEAAEAYLAWLGDWAFGDTVLTVSTNLVNQSFFISGFAEDAEVGAFATWDAATGNLVLTQSKGKGSYTKDNHVYDYSSIGWNEKVGILNDKGVIATLSMQENGTAKVTPIQKEVEAWDYNTDWSVVGTMTEPMWNQDMVMRTNGEWHVCTDVVLGDTDAFKVRFEGAWAVNAGGTFTALDEEFDVAQDGNDVCVGTAGTYDIWFNPETMKMKVITAGTYKYEEDFVTVSVEKFGIAGYHMMYGWDVDKDALIALPEIIAHPAAAQISSLAHRSKPTKKQAKPISMVR